MFKRKTTDSSDSEESIRLLSNNDPLDSNEQTEILEDLKLKANKDEKFWRSLFSFVFVLISIWFLGTFLNGLLYPWNFQYEFNFIGKVDFNIFQFYYLFSTINFGIAARNVKISYSRTPYWQTIIFTSNSFMLSFIWLAIFLKFNITNFTLYWLPLSPLILYSLVLYIDKDIANITQDLENLETLKYEFKKV